MPRTRSIPSSPDQIRNRLRDLAEGDGRKLTEIAEAAGMQPAQFSNVLNGHKANPSVGTVARILGAMGRRWRDLD